ncbi:MAG TPA: DUF4349 domain-containing protein [bacterium]|nr:DUF4349 domain-containing protein [bacterium]
MQPIFNWIKSNKAFTLLILFVAYYFGKQYLMGRTYPGSSRDFGYGRYDSISSNAFPQYSKGLSNTEEYMPTPIPEAPPQPNIETRMMVKNASQSLHVKNVKESINAIEIYTKNIGGYVVNKSLNEPQEASTGYVTLRIPAEKLEEALSYFGEKAVKVIYESVYGNDITDQYVDTQAKLEVLEKTKAIFVGMLDNATNFDQILRAQQEILNVQQQIDSVKGQIEYMEKTAKMSLVNIDISTDELSLGYAPADTWRPGVVFKLAVRSLVRNARQLGNTVIWVGVYAVLWVPTIWIFVKVRNLLKKKKGN